MERKNLATNSNMPVTASQKGAFITIHYKQGEDGNVQTLQGWITFVTGEDELSICRHSDGKTMLVELEENLVTINETTYRLVSYTLTKGDAREFEDRFNTHYKANMTRDTANQIKRSIENYVAPNMAYLQARVQNIERFLIERFS